MNQRIWCFPSDPKASHSVTRYSQEEAFLITKIALQAATISVDRVRSYQITSVKATTNQPLTSHFQSAWRPSRPYHTTTNHRRVGFDTPAQAARKITSQITVKRSQKPPPVEHHTRLWNTTTKIWKPPELQNSRGKTKQATHSNPRNQNIQTKLKKCKQENKKNNIEKHKSE